MRNQAENVLEMFFKFVKKKNNTLYLNRGLIDVQFLLLTDKEI